MKNWEEKIRRLGEIERQMQEYERAKTHQLIQKHPCLWIDSFGNMQSMS